VQAVLFVSLACFIKKLDIALCTMPNTSLNIFGSLAKSNLNGSVLCFDARVAQEYCTSRDIENGANKEK
jgi:hypothetical protein